MKVRNRAVVLKTAALIALSGYLYGQPSSEKVRVLVLAERGERHEPFVLAAKEWFDSLGIAKGLSFDYFENPDSLNDVFLHRYALIIQLNYPPYRWDESAKSAFKKFVETGQGGWIGFHHASLLGEFDGYPMWPWFSEFMGGIRWKDYIPTFVGADIDIEDRDHPVTRGLPGVVHIKKEEFYTYDKSPRSPSIHVLASVNESSYRPPGTVTMGDHPVVWTNTRVRARNVYIFMGHDPDLFNNIMYKKIVRNAIGWAAGR